MTTFKNKKKIIIIALSLFMALTMAIGLFTGLNKNVVKADDASYFEMEDGISIKLNEDGGMRFIVKMDTAIGQSLISGEKSMKFIIAPTFIFDYADSKDIKYIDLTQKIVVDVEKTKVYPDNANEPTCYYANGCVIKMNEANFNLTSEAVGYIEEDGLYTDRNPNATGTFYEKVNATFLNQDVEQSILSFQCYNSWYGTDKYPINIKTQEQYDKLVAKCNAGNTAFNGKNITCANEVQWNDADFTNPNAKPELEKYASILSNEISTWTGSEFIGGSLNSNAVSYKLGEYNVYETNGGYGQSIVNKSIVASNYSELHFAFKADAQVTLSNGDHQTNVITPNVWYFVKLERQVEGNWKIFAKAFGDSDYVELVASLEFFSSNATFETMFRTYLWTADTYNHTVYATDVWGVSVVDSEISAWESAGLTNTGFNALSDATPAGTLGDFGISKRANTGTDFIANTNIDSSLFEKLYFAIKAEMQVYLSSGDKNAITADTWYFVKLEKQVEGDWKIFAKAFGDSAYTELEASSEFFGADKAQFITMFRTYSWAGVGYNVYATDVWGVTIVDGEISAWESAGAVKLGSALNSSVASDEKLGGLTVYKTNGGFNKNIANTSIVASNYTELHFAYKTDKDVCLSNTDNQNLNRKDTWYFVKLEKQTDGSWKIFAKAVGDSDYTELVASTNLFGSNATFDSMFKTNLWTADTYNHTVFATDVWGVSPIIDEVNTWGTKLGSALKSNTVDSKYMIYDVYKMAGGYGENTANSNVDVSIYTELHFAFKADAQINLSNGDYQTNIISANTWHFVKLVKQVDGSWKIFAKVVGANEYTELVADSQFFSAENATFETMFRTYWYTDGGINHTVYATDVWGK